jgi:hypothetical protein
MLHAMHRRYKIARSLALMLALILIGSVVVAITLPSTLAQAVLWPASVAAQRQRAASSSVAAHNSVATGVAYAKVPLSFEANVGQTDPRVKYVAHGDGYNLFLTPGEAVLSLDRAAKRESLKTTLALHRKAKARPVNTAPTVLRLQLLGANEHTSLTGLERLPGQTNYLTGSDPRLWRTNVPNYTRVKYDQVYPGVDLFFYGHDQQLEYDFVVAPGADPKAITFNVAGVDRLEVNDAGDLLLIAAREQVRQRKPVIYQEVNGARKIVAGKYVVKGNHQFGFQIGEYDPTKPLIIDPVIDYSTLLSGSGADQGTAIAADSEGFVYITGMTDSLNFPTTAGAFSRTSSIGKDVFVSKLNPSGTALAYSTYLGGALDDEGYGIAVDANGQAYVTGTTASPNFPTTTGALMTFNSGGTDAFVAKLNSTGSGLVYSTYLGGSGFDEGFGIAVNSSGNAYVTGVTGSSNFPATVGVAQTTLAGPMDAFVTKLSATGATAIYSTYLGGRSVDVGFGIALDSKGANAFITGITDSDNFPTTAQAFSKTLAGASDAFVAKLNDTGSAAIYSTFLGGSGTDVGLGVAVDPDGAAYVSGATDSANFNVTAGVLQSTNGGGGTDAFVTKLNVDGSSLAYSTYLGGSGSDAAFGIALDPARNAYVTGTTSSANFPTVAPATTLGGGNDAFLTKVNPTGSALVLSRYLGGLNDEDGLGIAVDLASNVYVTGVTSSANFVTTTGAVQTGGLGGSEAFVTKITDVTTANPIDDARFFVQQHYLDFLNRLPDAGGLAFWTSEITSCGANQSCIDAKRINVSAAFFLSIEFQNTGYLVERFYKASYGDTTGTSTIGGAHQLAVPIARFSEFLPDTQTIGQGVVVGQTGWETVLENNKQAFTAEFVTRSRFTTAYPNTLTPTQFVNMLFANAGVVPTSTERQAAIDEFGGAGTSANAAARGRALRRVAENSTLAQQEFNRAFVLMQYFGYLRRNPNDPQDTDYTGYDFWLTKLNQFTQPGDDVLVRVQKAEMVKAFIVAGEYRQRFGP